MWLCCGFDHNSLRFCVVRQAADLHPVWLQDSRNLTWYVLQGEAWTNHSFEIWGGKRENRVNLNSWINRQVDVLRGSESWWTGPGKHMCELRVQINTTFCSSHIDSLIVLWASLAPISRQSSCYCECEPGWVEIWYIDKTGTHIAEPIFTLRHCFDFNIATAGFRLKLQGSCVQLFHCETQFTITQFTIRN